MNNERIFLGAYWRERRITARDYIRLCHEFLARLRGFSPAFANCCVVLGEEVVVAPADADSFERILARALPDPTYSYVNPDPAVKSFTLDSTFPLGFRISFSDPDPAATEETAVSVSVTAGSYGDYSPTNVVLIDIPPTYSEFWVNKSRAMELMSLVVETWRPAFATLSSRELRKELDPKRANDFVIGPLTYFADKQAANVSRGTASVDTAPGGGLFLSIDAPAPWAKFATLFKPCYDRLTDAKLLAWNREARVEE